MASAPGYKYSKMFIAFLICSMNRSESQYPSLFLPISMYASASLGMGWGSGPSTPTGSDKDFKYVSYCSGVNESLPVPCSRAKPDTMNDAPSFFRAGAALPSSAYMRFWTLPALPVLSSW
eukprot:Pompholyxophrys_punicea_v1_NODE_455_length_1916_cov_39.531435.p2 type:complete len:120 gc:universal NODE_455_length_1916_cov_39.531435:979-620(-)